MPNLAGHDFDEIAVPSNADAAWRHRANERWVQRALEYEAQGSDLLLAGQTPLGELLAAPSASRLQAISACLIVCDETRIARLYERGADWRAGDPRWHVRVPDTTSASVEEVADDLIAWIGSERASLRSGTHSLTGATLGT